MSRASGATVDNSFIAGLVTQATGLNFPENACTDTDNCVFDERGYVYRRYPIDLENGFSTLSVTLNSSAITSFFWRNVSGDGVVNLVVVQIGSTLYFYRTDNPLGLSSGKLSGTIDLTTFSPSGAPSPAGTECQFAYGLGYLFVVHPALNPFAVSYDSIANAFATITIDIQIRDFIGEPDGLTLTNRPSTLSDAHNYNLQNQSWDSTKITTWYTSQTNYPSNADMWWLYLNTSDVFDPTTQANVSPGNTPAANGHFIFDAFNQDRTGVSGIGSFPVVTSGTARPSSCAFFAGRVFYAGVNYTGYNSTVYFSRIILDSTQFGQAYQDADPTNNDNFALEPDDGGTFIIPDAGIIYKLFSFGNYLLVFAQNGVWAVTGSQGVGFAANDYSVASVTNIKCISPTSFVDMGGTPSWWNLDGIYVIQPGQNGLEAQSLTDKKIKEYYLEIPTPCIRVARGYYNSFTHVCQWVFSDTAANTVDGSYQYDHVLSFNALSGAFYPWSVSPGTNLHGIVVLETGGNAFITESDVAVGTSLVIDGTGDQVISFGLGEQANVRTTTKYLVTYPSGGSTLFTFAESADFSEGYTDWVKTGSSVSYDSYFITGFKVHTEGQRKFQDNYLYVFSDNSVPQSYVFQSIWDYSGNSSTGRWSNPQLIVLDGLDFNVRRRRLKVRGQGYAVQFLFSSNGTDPFRFIGWSASETANRGI